MISDAIRNATPYEHQPTTAPTTQGRSTITPNPWNLDATSSHRLTEVHHTFKANFEPTSDTQNNEMKCQFCDICIRFGHNTTSCKYRDTILDSSPQNLEKFGTTKADSIIALTLFRKGILTHDDIRHIHNRHEWNEKADQLYHSLLSNPMQATTLTEDEPPHEHDYSFVYGTATHINLRDLLNKQKHVNNQPTQTAYTTQQFHHFIRQANSEEGLNPFPLPDFDWNKPANQIALAAAITRTIIHTHPPSANTPPISTQIFLAALCQKLVICGADLNTTVHIQYDTTSPNKHLLEFYLGFSQDINTQAPGLEPEYLQPDGACRIKLLTLTTDDFNVITQTNHSSVFRDGCILLSRYFLDQKQADLCEFSKWVVDPYTGQFQLIPNDHLRQKVQLLASQLQQLIPASLIHEANDKSPNNTTITDHTKRPYLCINLAKEVTQHAHHHDHMWELTDVLITAFTAHKNWTFTTLPNPTDVLLVVTDSAQQSSTGSGPTVLEVPSVPKSPPPHVPGSFPG